MTIVIPQPLTLEQFLKLPYIEDSPAWEFSQGTAIQKPMPGGKHSRLQSRLGGAINALNSPYEAFPELRCTFGGRSIVPDLVVLATHQIPVDSNGDVISTGINFAPAWMIEILSPEQGQMRVTRNILHSLRHGGQMGWLIDPDERVVLVYRPDCLPNELTDDAWLPCLPGVDLVLTVEQLFGWLKLS
ncbi:Uma2 family endonuclease [Thermocoleostomius sinensis]|uniref:Uma2 family endonuclease n=1 Tax=Thermocoleostomius sinensis A174 TaxID=2016057 RepID=A0A9E9C9Y6_9CYAN|nr:Uma2 family endonuclease [Thermocoleostomius sinensis]WAL58280.1 Uma2 family endonuclease [Thermocoleostomius sinensis A174]